MSIPLAALPSFPHDGSEVTSVRALHARHTLAKHLNGLSSELTRDLPPLAPPATELRYADLHFPAGSPVPIAEARIHVGVVGAGAAGLYAGMILDHFKDKFSYEILEANPTRVGGRLYTHKFPGGQPNDYYDVGAMRFPHLPFMTRTLNLLKRLGIKTIPYILSLPHNLNLFNNITLTNAEIDGQVDPFRTRVPGVDKSSSEMESAQLGGFKEQLARDFDAGWNDLVDNYDEYSVRAYMVYHGTNGIKYSNQVVDYLETFETGSGLYDQALTEAILDSIMFGYPHPPGEETEWSCVQGGTEQIATKMKDSLTGPVHAGKRVTALSFDDPKAPAAVRVAVAGENTPRTYQHVISTLPFGCLRSVDTSAFSLSWPLQQAIRMIHYDGPTKVGIQFSSRWWEAPPLNQFGGSSRTDRPTRVVVYPSYGINQTAGATMLVSYTWGQDALRIGSLVRGRNSSAEARLIDLILDDLAVIHSVDKSMLESLMVDYHAFYWYDNELSVGGIAKFGPGQFSTLFPEVTKPYHGMFHFAGEATSVHHGWLNGALNSAYRAVKEILVQYDDKNQTLVKKLEKNFGKLDEIDDDALKLQVRLGRHRSQ